MEYYSVRVKLSACESNRLGVFNPLSMVKNKKKICVRTDNEIWRFCAAGTDLRWWHKRAQWEMLLNTISRVHLQQKNCNYHVAYIFIVTDTICWNFQLEKSQIDATLKKKEH